MATDADLHERVRKGVAERERTTEQQGLRGLTHVEIAVEGHSTFRAHSPSEPEFTLTVDEPEERGGRNQGPPPLAYFLTGVGTCLLMQVARLIIARDLDLRVLGMHMRGERERQVGGGFLHIIQEIDAEGSPIPHTKRCN